MTLFDPFASEDELGIGVCYAKDGDEEVEVPFAAPEEDGDSVRFLDRQQLEETAAWVRRNIANPVVQQYFYWLLRDHDQALLDAKYQSEMADSLGAKHDEAKTEIASLKAELAALRARVKATLGDEPLFNAEEMEEVRRKADFRRKLDDLIQVMAEAQARKDELAERQKLEDEVGEDCEPDPMPPEVIEEKGRKLAKLEAERQRELQRERRRQAIRRMGR